MHDYGLVLHILKVSILEVFTQIQQLQVSWLAKNFMLYFFLFFLKNKQEISMNNNHSQNPTSR